MCIEFAPNRCCTRTAAALGDAPEVGVVRALSQNEPATPRNLQLTCSRVVERMVETNSTLSVPAFVWEFVCSEIR